MDFIWIIFILFSLQPVVAKKLLQNARVKLLSQIEKERNSRVVTLIHRQESMNLLGFPMVKFINMEDAEKILRFLETTEPDTDIDLVLHTPGGLVLAASQIARAISHRKGKGKTRVIVPHYAMSGGTLIALAADEIIMSPNAVLGPVDPQLGQYPAPSLLKLIKQKDPNEISDEMLINADIAEKAINQLQACIKEILLVNHPKEKAEELANILTEGRWTHDFPITCAFAKELGLPVNDNITKNFLDLMTLYSQPVNHQSSVQYLGRNKLPTQEENK
jgi:ClpP class serine protease